MLYVQNIGFKFLGKKCSLGEKCSLAKDLNMTCCSTIRKDLTLGSTHQVVFSFDVPLEVSFHISMQ